MITRSDCEKMDATDPMAAVRDLFTLPEGEIYLDGNSLGALPKAAPARIAKAVEQEWGVDLIRSWGKAEWFTMPERLGDRLGRLIGAAEGQIVVCDSTSINIYKALHAAMAARPDRKVIVSETASFPTDLYMIEGALAGQGNAYSSRLLGRDGDDIAELIDGDVAAVLLSNVDYKTGALHDMERITKLAHDAGAMVIWDLCHSAGVIPMELDRIGADFAVGCTYKYLNAGPGAPAYIYVATRHQERTTQPLSGWWGHAAPFAFETAYRPTSGIRRFLCGTQPILSMTGVETALDVFDTFDIKDARAKSQKLTGLFMDLVAQSEICNVMRPISPREDAIRGSQVSYAFENGYPVVKAMIEKGVVGDFRAPDVMRFGFAPCYLRYVDVFDAVAALEDALTREVWNIAKYCEMEAVT
ncbi:kynureninase [Halocynthiibacter sp. C4]|uniref:kynureninase n=1 Tax=Halocynthiibacter sp. C4 TaxID=2992758 RepID=UPI00237A5F94|nr:kynureninase [Halocynthiibacter sp. C4]MDE0590581.1 kynureninase [Halocynthiibacter sp. C4]